MGRFQDAAAAIPAACLTNSGQHWRSKKLIACRCDGMDRLTGRRPYAVGGVCDGQRRHNRSNNAIPMLRCNGLERLIQGLAAKVPGVVGRHKERGCRFDYELIHSASNPLQGVSGEGANGGKPILRFDFLF